MKLTVDANVLFAALIRPGPSRQILYHPHLELYAPYFLLDELSKYRSLLITKSKMAESDFDRLCALTISQLNVISKMTLLAYMRPASRLVSDPKDAAYLACALCVGSDIVSNDPHLHAQRRVTVFSVDSLARVLKLIS